MNLDLFRQDLVTNFLAILPVVWAFAKHALVSNDSHGEVINSDAMILTAHNLRGHVAWRS